MAISSAATSDTVYRCPLCGFVSDDLEDWDVGLCDDGELVCLACRNVVTVDRFDLRFTLTAAAGGGE